MKLIHRLKRWWCRQFGHDWASVRTTIQRNGRVIDSNLALESCQRCGESQIPIVNSNTSNTFTITNVGVSDRA